jgi:hypothetical protein
LHDDQGTADQNQELQRQDETALSSWTGRLSTV